MTADLLSAHYREKKAHRIDNEAVHGKQSKYLHNLFTSLYYYRVQVLKANQTRQFVGQIHHILTREFTSRFH